MGLRAALHDECSIAAASSSRRSDWRPDAAQRDRALLLRLLSERRRPEQRLTDDYPLPVERRKGGAVKVIAERERVAHPPAERVVVRAGEESVPR
jgi:hypothetical protein